MYNEDKTFDHDYRTDHIYEMIFDEFLSEDIPLVVCNTCKEEFYFDDAEVSLDGTLACPKCVPVDKDSEI